MRTQDSRRDERDLEVERRGEECGVGGGKGNDDHSSEWIEMN